MEKNKREMPEWMEKYRDTFHDTGGQAIENLMNDNAASEFSVIKRAGIVLSVKEQIFRFAQVNAIKAQVKLLTSLYKKNWLK